MGDYKKFRGYRTSILGKQQPCWVWRTRQDERTFEDLNIFDPLATGPYLTDKVIDSLKETTTFPRLDPESKEFDSLDIINAFGRHFRNVAIVEIESIHTNSFWFSADGLNGMRRALHNIFLSDEGEQDFLSSSLDTCIDLLALTSADRLRESGLVEIETKGYEDYPPFIPTVFINGSMMLSSFLAELSPENADINFVPKVTRAQLRGSIDHFRENFEVDENLKKLVYPNIVTAPELHRIFFCETKKDAESVVKNFMKDSVSFPEQFVAMSRSSSDAAYLAAPTKTLDWHVDLSITGVYATPIQRFALANAPSPFRRYMTSSWAVPGQVPYRILSKETTVDEGRRRISVNIDVEEDTELYSKDA